MFSLKGPSVSSLGVCGNVAGKHSNIALHKYDRRQIGVQVGSEFGSRGSWRPTCIYMYAPNLQFLACVCMHARAHRKYKCELKFGSIKVQIPVGFRVCKN
jgi:hypothetical protein